MAKHRAFLVDVEFIMRHKQPALRLFLVDEQGRAFRAFDDAYEPYFYLLPDAKLEGRERELFKQRLAAEKVPHHNELARVKRVDEEEKRWRGERVKLFKIVAFNPGHVPALRDAVKPLGETFEHKIPFTKRYLIDKQLVPSALVELELDGEKRVTSIRSVADPAMPPLRLFSFDLETHNPRGVSEPQRDPILMIGYAADPRPGAPASATAPAVPPAGTQAAAVPPAGTPEAAARVLSHSKKFSESFVRVLATEKAMLEEFARVVKDSRAHVLCTYNGDQFDVPFLAERAKRTKAAFSLARDGGPIKTRQAGPRKVSSVSGRVHFDVFNSIAFLNYIGAIRVPRLTLERVYAEVLGKQKPMVERKDIFATWDAGKTSELDELARYCKGDALACLDLAHYALPLELGLSRVVGDTLFNVSRASSSQLVEHVLMRRAFARGELIPNKPGADGDARRDQGPIQGAFVKTPAPGVYENIAVIDFKSLYPSIIVSHNIDPGTLDCTDCGPKEAFVSPQGHRFCAKRKGLIPEMLEDVMKSRWAVQADMKKHPKDSDAYRRLYAQQWALKILMNSTYGYLLFNRARWYSREGGEATTAWARQYIQETIEKAEKAGLPVLYSDTDSAFLLYQKGGEDGVKKFIETVNASLPKQMQLELEEFYPRGIFVSKKQEAETGAKKKYALIDRTGRIKIRGFELVRRDWSRVARETQRRVLEALLKDGDVEKAKRVVIETIENLRAGRVPLSDCVILTQLRKNVKAYDIKSPEVSAVEHARKAGLEIPELSVVAYIITKDGKTISEKAQVAELAKDYDPDYYTNNQVLPSVLKILAELGINADDLKTNTKQKGLHDW